MPQTEVLLHATAPGAHKSIIQSAADYGAGERNQAANPFFRRFLAQFEGQPFRNARRQPLENLFFRKVLAVVNAGGRSGSHPQFKPLALTTVLESVEQAKSLDKPQRKNGQQPRVRNDRD